MRKGKFYSVGVGPGDPMLMTFKAAEVMRASDIIAVPDSGGSENVALKIAEAHVKDKKIVTCDMPMVREKAKLDAYHAAVTEQIEGYLNNGQTVAFLTLGDPSIYSTTLYIHNRLAQRGFETEIVPGVPSFCAAAASLNTSLCEGSQPLHIIPASYDDAGLSLGLPGNKVLMKSGKSLGALKEQLRARGDACRTMMVERASMENEKVYPTLESIDENASYFSLIVVKEADIENGGTSS